MSITVKWLKLKNLLIKILRYLIYYFHQIPSLLFLICLESYDLLIGEKKTSEQHIIRVYKYLVKRIPNREEIEFFKLKMSQLDRPYLGLIFSFLMIPATLEYKLFKTNGIVSHHLARLELVQKYLPSARTIIDLGGATDFSKDGALLSMGYPYIPERVYVVDLPSEQRMFQDLNSPNLDRFVNSKSIEIIYRYTSMTDLSCFSDDSIDLVWSGQSIEHVTPTQAEIVFKQIYRILKLGGYFCLDTPNRKLTQLQVKYGWVHPEHKIEYFPGNLINKIEKFGFKAIDKKAVSPMPFSCKNSRFNRLELINSPGIDSNIIAGYSFYLKFQKIINCSKK